MITLNKLNKLISDFVTAHDLIQTYAFEDVVEQSDVVYPLLQAVLKPTLIDEGSDKNVITFYLSDKVKKGARNKIEVLSDMREVAKDLLSYFKQIDFEEIFGFYLDIDTNVTLNDFSDVDVDGTAGYYFDVSFESIFNWDVCGIPAELPTGVTSPAFVTIYDQDGNVVTTLTAGENYTVTIVSAIDGGNATTVFTNTVIGE